MALEKLRELKAIFVRDKVVGDQNQLGHVHDFFRHLAFVKWIIDKRLGTPMTQFTNKQIHQVVAKFLDSSRALFRVSHHKHRWIILLSNLSQNFEAIKGSSHFIDVRRIKYTFDMVKIKAFKVSNFQMIYNVIALLNNQRL